MSYSPYVGMELLVCEFNLVVNNLMMVDGVIIRLAKLVLSPQRRLQLF